jgi:nitroreductase
MTGTVTSVQDIGGRRSVREGFMAEPVARAAIEEIVRCGLAAPSSKNSQPWRMHVVTDSGALHALADAVQHARDAARYAPIDPSTGRLRRWDSTVAESATVLRSVPLGIFVENLGPFSGGRAAVAAADVALIQSALVGYGLELASLGAAIENMWLAAHGLGLVGVFMGDVAVAEEEIAQRLGLEGDLVGVLALGHPGPDATPVPKRIEEGRVVHHG